MLTQLLSLIFFYIRYTDPQEAERAKMRPHYVTYFDPVVEYYTRVNGLQSTNKKRQQEEHQIEQVKEYDEIDTSNENLLNKSENVSDSSEIL